MIYEWEKGRGGSGRRVIMSDEMTPAEGCGLQVQVAMFR
jgi:hypothetical protein